jgi:hypothetical protein
MDEGRSEKIVEFAFVSEVADALDETELARFVRHIWRDNLAQGITGVLRLRGRRLEVAIEGPGSLVLARGARLMADARHGAIAVRAFGPIAARRACGWRVEGFVPPRLTSAAARAAAAKLPRLRPADRDLPAAAGLRSAALT